MVIVDYLVGLALDAVKEKAENKLDESRLKRDIRTYIEEHKKYNEVCDLAQDCDFRSLMDYLSGDLISDVGERLFAVDSKKRAEAQKSIVTAAVAYSKADTDDARGKIARLVAECLEIIREAIGKKISLEDYYLAAEVVDVVEEDINEAIKSMGEEIKETVRDSYNELMEKMKSLNKSKAPGSLFSLDDASRLAQEGNFLHMETDIRKLMDVISLEHPLYPAYGYTFGKDGIRSIPIAEEGLKNYPPKMRITGTVRAGDHDFKDQSTNPLNYAYRHQCCLQIKVRDAVKLLGDKQPDPIQREAEKLIGKEIEVKPKEFPPAFPCSIKVGDKTFFNYVMLRTQEILDDRTYIISNKEQEESKIHVELHAKFTDVNEMKEQNSTATEVSTFKISIEDADHIEMLNYDKFILEYTQQRRFCIFNLKEQKDFIVGAVAEYNYKPGIDSLEEEINFLERVCAVEKYFDIQIEIPQEVSGQEYQHFIWVSDLIMQKEITSTWKQATFSGVVDEDLKSHINDWCNSPHEITYAGLIDINLLGVKCELNIMRTYVDAKVQDSEKTRKAIEAARIGDEVQILLKPGQDNRAIDRIYNRQEQNM